MGDYADELRLLLAIAMNVSLLACAWRFARRWTSDSIQICVDTLLIYYLAQYLSVGFAGLLGILSLMSIVIVGAMACAMLWYFENRNEPLTPMPPRDRWTFLACGFFQIGYLLTVIWQARAAPVIFNDSLTYHLPAAVRWLQTGRLGVFETWFFNPANTYSPLAGSIFITWLLAPMQNDVLARFVQVPALILVFVASIQLVRALGGSIRLASVIALAIVVARPFISHSITPKDDLFVVGFFLTALASFGEPHVRGSIAPWRIGAALGLMLATKYTALLSVPVLLLAIDAPIRAKWNWRAWLGCVGAIVLLAGPWFWRNWLHYGNPVYPIRFAMFDGLFATRRSEKMQSLSDIWSILTDSYYKIPSPNLIILIAGWLVAIGLWRKEILKDPLVRASIIGPILGIGIFLAISPYAELRFANPSIALLFASCGLMAIRSPQQWVAAGVVLLAAGGTGFIPELLAMFLPIACVFAALGCGLAYAIPRIPPAARLPSAGALALALFMLIYIQWSAFVQGYRLPESTREYWSNPYAERFAAWDFVRTQIPAGEPIAYANTYFVYPLMGFDLDRIVAYIPTRSDVENLSDLPPLADPVSGEQLPRAITRVTTEQPDSAAWLRRLDQSGVKYLLVEQSKDFPDPPELEFARNAGFVRIFPDDPARFPGNSITVFRIK